MQITETTLCCAAAALFSFSAASLIAAEGICPRDKVLAGDAAEGDWFGFSVAIDDVTAIIGAPKNAVGGIRGGSAYIFQFLTADDRWDEVTRLTPVGSSSGDEFGSAVGVSGDFAVVGDPLADSSGSAPNSGAAYIFDRNAGGPDTWQEVMKLQPSELAADDRFGFSLDIDGQTAVIGAPQQDAGAVYVYRSDATAAGGWGLVKKIVSPDGQSGDQFGFSVAIQGDLLVVGARRHDASGGDSGAAYVFQRDEGGMENWGQLDKLAGTDTSAGDEFGASVDLDGDLLLVGAWLRDGMGAAYVFEPAAPGDWAQAAIITADDIAADDGFGFSVALDDGLALISSHRHDEPAADAGAAYLFGEDRGGSGAWGQIEKVTADDGGGSDRFSRSLAMDVPHAMIGAYQHDEDATNDGATYTYRAGEVDCNDNGVCDDVDIAKGTSIDFNGNGIPDECECLGDIDRSGEIGFEDLLSMLSAWGPCPGCPEDLDVSGTVGFTDVIYLIGAWGPCTDG